MWFLVALLTLAALVNLDKEEITFDPNDVEACVVWLSTKLRHKVFDGEDLVQYAVERSLPGQPFEWAPGGAVTYLKHLVDRATADHKSNRKRKGYGAVADPEGDRVMADSQADPEAAAASIERHERLRAAAFAEFADSPTVLPILERIAAGDWTDDEEHCQATGLSHPGAQRPLAGYEIRGGLGHARGLRQGTRMTRKLTPAEEGQNLEDFAVTEAIREEAERLPTRTKADVDASIAGSGHDESAARALGRRAAEAYAQAAARRAPAPPAAAPPPPTPIPITRARRSWPTYAAVLAVAALVLLFLHPWRDDPNVVSGDDDAAALAADAARLRELALDDYAGGRYELARGKLDRARALDDGKEPASAAELRRKVMTALGDAGATRTP